MKIFTDNQVTTIFGDLIELEKIADEQDLDTVQGIRIKDRVSAIRRILLEADEVKIRLER